LWRRSSFGSAASYQRATVSPLRSIIVRGLMFTSLSWFLAPVGCLSTLSSCWNLLFGSRSNRPYSSLRLRSPLVKGLLFHTSLQYFQEATEPTP